MKQPEPIEQLLEDLQSSNPSLRKTAAEELGRRVPAKLRTIQALHLAAQADTNEGVRSAAAESFRYLTNAEQPQLSRKTAAKMTKAPTTSSGSRVLQSTGKLVLGAILSFVLTVVISAIVTVFPHPTTNSLVIVILIANLLVAIYFARVRQFSVAAGIPVGLVASLAIDLAIEYFFNRITAGITW